MRWTNSRWGFVNRLRTILTTNWSINQSRCLYTYMCFFFFVSAGIGCKVAGFLTVFATHLSVFTLTLITIERWYAITHAIYLNKRIKIKAAACIMVCGWIYSMVMSSLPLFGFSNYSSTRYDQSFDDIDHLFCVVLSGDEPATHQ